MGLKGIRQHLKWLEIGSRYFGSKGGHQIPLVRTWNISRTGQRPYHKHALYWMTESEKGVDAEETKETLHPCWAAYRICDKKATTKFPKATQITKGGILAYAMGLGKTMTTISLILARPGKGIVAENNTKKNRQKK
ncbi:putative SWI/SNF-related matrix-associated actin-dependent regulator of chromatin subfamily A member 3-like protein 3 [Tanacetum coccineum]